MPKVDKIFTLEITPEQFLRNCSRQELIETDMLLNSPNYQKQMYPEAASDKQLIARNNPSTYTPF